MSGWFRLNRDDESIAEEAMRRIGIEQLAERPFAQLSGGQRQLVLIARAMAQQTPLILLDEPTSALDFSNQLAVWNVLREVASKGVAILVCCHDPNHILWFCDKAAVMHGGGICAEGPASDIMTEDVLQHIYGPQCVRISTGTAGMVCPRQTKR
jgi:iron complex transport system ATP-binding protein